MRSKAMGWVPIVVLLAACRGQFEAVPELTASPEAIDFGEHQEDRHEPRAETVRFVNTGLVPLDITSVTIEGEASRALFVESAQALLEPGEVLPIEVRFGTASLPEDFYSAELVVSGDAVSIDAAGCQPGVEPTVETFEEVVTLTFSVRNECDADGDGFIAAECDGTDCDDTDPTINPGAVELCNGIDDDCDGELPDLETDDDLDGQSECELDCDDTDPTVFTGATEVCNGIDDDCDGELPPLELDADGDGFRACDDCNDSDPGVFPGAAEQCDGEDNDCDGFIPFVESDNDGDGVPICLGDCDDADPSVSPDAPEICDGRDNDCDGDVDEGTDADLDGDGWSICDGDCDDTDPQNFPGNVEVCDGQDNDCDGVFGDEELDLDGDGVRTCDGDCDDDDPELFPGNTEVCDGRDNDCDDVIDEGFDNDGDGFSVCDGDCDDDQPTVFPGAPEQCNGFDDDCDGVVPANEIDNDGDGFDTCQCLSLFASPECDCNDTDPEIFPGAPEQCNGINDSCSPDGVRGESDEDGDGFRACEECDDDTAARFPGNPEVCDGIDNDCDLVIPADETTDADGDGFVVCLECDDADASVNPDAAEIPCDGIDNNCDGIQPSEEGEDLDGDGAEACEDCDDGNANVFPGAPEQCNGEDDDCDGDIDEGVDVDADGDGVSACAGDCDDTNPDVFPGAVELCNFIDDNCNSAFDEPFRTGAKYTDEAHCGTCNNDCSVAEFANASGFCETSPAFPFCDYVCDTGFFDVNGLADDGCECEFISAIDEPFDGIDANCDGEDGDPDQAVFVSSIFGNAGASGTIDDPVRDIQAGIDLADSLGLRFVNVAIGSYGAFDVRDGINVSGGYDLMFSTRDPVVNRSSLRGVGPMVRAVGIGTETVVDGLDIEANGASGTASIGVWIEDSPALVFSRNTVFADTGFNGMPGGDGAFGTDGAQGEDGAEGGTTTCASLPLGGAGGFNTCDGFETSGGNGADMNCPTGFILQPTGQGGRPAFAGGSAGAGSCDSVLALNDEVPPDCTCFIDPSCWDGGEDGGNGLSGTDGNGGSGGTAPAGNFQPLASGGWSPSGGGTGGDGDLGGGGGGGGSGSGVEATNCSQDGIGGTGGGGGAGGCGGQRGLGGTGGGASIGIVVFDHGASFPDLFGNTVASSNGGVGGAGGDGGQGGTGGFGGEGGEANRDESFCTEDGGDGGNGGNGGTGGGGGGGAGGPSFAIYVDAPVDAPRYDDQNILTHGDGGLGGQRGNGGDTPGSDGTSGVNGSEGALNY